jgi:CRISPR-associated endonuclease/helicase Cas3
MTDSTYYKYWEKAEKEGNNHHLLVYHCLDVAAVGYVLITKNAYFRNKLLNLVGLDEETCLFLMLSFLFLHGAGKLTESFQGLRQDLLQKLQGKESHRHCIRHDRRGYLLWEQN